MGPAIGVVVSGGVLTAVLHGVGDAIGERDGRGIGTRGGPVSGGAAPLNAATNDTAKNVVVIRGSIRAICTLATAGSCDV